MQQHEPRGGATAGTLRPSQGLAFEAWLSAHEGALQRTAHLLTGSVHAAQDLVQNCLARLYRRWDRIPDVDDLDDDAARRVLVDEFRTAWRRPGRRGDLLVEVVPDRPVPGTPLPRSSARFPGAAHQRTLTALAGPLLSVKVRETVTWLVQ